MEKAIESCEHKDELQLFASQHNTALCNECYFENQEHWGKTLTLKQAANMHLQHLEQIQKECEQNLHKCAEMQEKIRNQERLEDEISKKVDREFDYLKQIID